MLCTSPLPPPHHQAHPHQLHVPHQQSQYFDDSSYYHLVPSPSHLQQLSPSPPATPRNSNQESGMMHLHLQPPSMMRDYASTPFSFAQSPQRSRESSNPHMMIETAAADTRSVPTTPFQAALLSMQNAHRSVGGGVEHLNHYRSAAASPALTIGDLTVPASAVATPVAAVSTPLLYQPTPLSSRKNSDHVDPMEVVVPLEEQQESGVAAGPQSKNLNNRTRGMIEVVSVSDSEMNGEVGGNGGEDSDGDYVDGEGGSDDSDYDSEEGEYEEEEVQQVTSQQAVTIVPTRTSADTQQRMRDSWRVLSFLPLLDQKTRKHIKQLDLVMAAVCEGLIRGTGLSQMQLASQLTRIGDTLCRTGISVVEICTKAARREIEMEQQAAAVREIRVTTLCRSTTDLLYNGDDVEEEKDVGVKKMDVVSIKIEPETDSPASTSFSSSLPAHFSSRMQIDVNETSDDDDNMNLGAIQEQIMLAAKKAAESLVEASNGGVAAVSTRAAPRLQAKSRWQTPPSKRNGTKGGRRKKRKLEDDDEEEGEDAEEENDTEDDDYVDTQSIRNTTSNDKKCTIPHKKMRRSGCSDHTPSIFNESSIKVLQTWFREHIQDPYPDADMKMKLAKEAQLSYEQVTHWFINARSRAWRPLLNARAQTKRESSTSVVDSSSLPALVKIAACARGNSKPIVSTAAARHYLKQEPIKQEDSEGDDEMSPSTTVNEDPHTTTATSTLALHIARTYQTPHRYMSSQPQELKFKSGGRAGTMKVEVNGVEVVREEVNMPATEKKSKGKSKNKKKSTY